MTAQQRSWRDTGVLDGIRSPLHLAAHPHSTLRAAPSKLALRKRQKCSAAMASAPSSSSLLLSRLPVIVTSPQQQQQQAPTAAVAAIPAGCAAHLIDAIAAQRPHVGKRFEDYNIADPQQIASVPVEVLRTLPVEALEELQARLDTRSAYLGLQDAADEPTPRAPVGVGDASLGSKPSSPASSPKGERSRPMLSFRTSSALQPPTHEQQKLSSSSIGGGVRPPTQVTFEKLERQIRQFDLDLSQLKALDANGDGIFDPEEFDQLFARDGADATARAVATAGRAPFKSTVPYTEKELKLFDTNDASDAVALHERRLGAASPSQPRHYVPDRSSPTAHRGDSRRGGCLTDGIDTNPHFFVARELLGDPDAVRDSCVRMHPEVDVAAAVPRPGATLRLALLGDGAVEGLTGAAAMDDEGGTSPLVFQHMGSGQQQAPQGITWGAEVRVVEPANVPAQSAEWREQQKQLKRLARSRPCERAGSPKKASHVARSLRERRDDGSNAQLHHQSVTAGARFLQQFEDRRTSSGALAGAGGGVRTGLRSSSRLLSGGGGSLKCGTLNDYVAPDEHGFARGEMRLAPAISNKIKAVMATRASSSDQLAAMLADARLLGHGNLSARSGNSAANGNAAVVGGAASGVAGGGFAAVGIGSRRGSVNSIVSSSGSRHSLIAMQQQQQHPVSCGRGSVSTDGPPPVRNARGEPKRPSSAAAVTSRLTQDHETPAAASLLHLRIHLATLAGTSKSATASKF